MNKPNLSIIIPTYNRRLRLQRVLEALQNQSVPLEQFEVIVISDGSIDGTNEYLEEIQARPSLEQPLQLSAIFQANQGVAVARNQGIKKARADLILFLDDDVIPSPDLVKAHLSFEPRDKIVLGPMLTPRDIKLASWVLWEQRMLEKQYQAMLAGHWEPTARQFYTGNTSLYKKYLLKSGGFDPSFRRAEDVELAYRLSQMGCSFVFYPEAEAYHYADRSFLSWNNSAYSYGKNDVIMTRKKGQNWLLPTILREYFERNWIIRLLVRLCLSRPILFIPVTSLLTKFASLGDKLGIEKISRYAYSGVFNLRFYQGIADELGSRKLFWEELDLSFRPIEASKG
ncbi:MAG: glycosyltransferase [Chloroflexi bacterium]|nr:glycosyltransferase [Chloroflexota bacterium]